MVVKMMGFGVTMSGDGGANENSATYLVWDRLIFINFTSSFLFISFIHVCIQCLVKSTLLVLV
jgi:hypothetical protein